MYHRGFSDLLIHRYQTSNNLADNSMYWKSPVLKTIYGNERLAHFVWHAQIDRHICINGVFSEYQIEQFYGLIFLNKKLYCSC